MYNFSSLFGQPLNTNSKSFNPSYTLKYKCTSPSALVHESMLYPLTYPHVNTGSLLCLYPYSNTRSSSNERSSLSRIRPDFLPLSNYYLFKIVTKYAYHLTTCKTTYICVYIKN